MRPKAGIFDRPIPGATGATLTLTNVTAADAGLYTVRVGSIGYGSVGSTYLSNFARSLVVVPLPPQTNAPAATPTPAPAK